MKYKKLFEPGKIGQLELRNRVVMTAMGVHMGEWNGCANEDVVRFYEERAKGGVGLIIPEFTSVDGESGHCSDIQLGIMIPDISRVLNVFVTPFTATERKSSFSFTTEVGKHLRHATAVSRPWLPA